MSEAAPLVSVVILSYSWTQYLQCVIESVVGQNYPNLEIILIDNHGAAGNEVARIAGEFPAVRLIRNSVNLGFSGAMNLGLAEASGSYVFLTEDDLVLHPGCLSALVSCMSDHPDVVLAAPIVYNRSSRTIRSAGGRFSLGSIYQLTILGQGETDTRQFTDAFDVMYVPAGCALTRTATLRSMNGFREDYFLYQEDLELCIRILKSGKRILTVPAAGVDHFEPPPGPSADLIDFLRIRNFYVTYLLHARAAVLPVFYIRYALIDFLRALTRDRRRARLTAKAWFSFVARIPRLLRERDPRPIRSPRA